MKINLHPETAEQLLAQSGSIDQSHTAVEQPLEDLSAQEQQPAGGDLFVMLATIVVAAKATLHYIEKNN